MNSSKVIDKFMFNWYDLLPVIKEKIKEKREK